MIHHQLNSLSITVADKTFISSLASPFTCLLSYMKSLILKPTILKLCLQIHLFVTLLLLPEFLCIYFCNWQEMLYNTTVHQRGVIMLIKLDFWGHEHQFSISDGISSGNSSSRGSSTLINMYSIPVSPRCAPTLSMPIARAKFHHVKQRR